ncbi:MAG: hypothetical protein KC502_01890 [Myxococcales bacterium]|nr:hypothetical protein [Myxococcales bacterium]
MSRDHSSAVRSPLGWCASEGCFRLCAPKADHVELVERRHPNAEPQRLTTMRLAPGDRGVWRADVPVPLGYYRFRVHHRWGTVTVADPWSRAVVRRKTAGHPTWSVATPPLHPTGTGVTIDRDAAVIIEVHLSDATAHASAGTTAPGTYAGFAEQHAAAIGGSHHVRALGADTVELLPVTSWPVFEGDRTNHWGYMPSYLLAASARYTPAWAAAERGAWVGVDDNGVFDDPAAQLRDLVTALHAQGLGVILDVVYNHVSAHDQNPLLLLDPGDWFHRDQDGGYRSHSGCGNDLNTSAAEMRALVVASVRRWFAEIGVDGLRFDLAELIDDETLREIRAVATAIRPDALLIAEPWSLGGYRPAQLADMGWTVWDDHYRNDLKGRSPDERGLLLAADVRPDDTRIGSLAAHLAGGSHPVGGRLPSHDLGLSYLVSHDGYTLGDFVRQCHGESVPQREDALSAEVAAAMRLANAALLATRGPVMMHLGQSWARSKVKAGETPGHSGSFEENSYDLDDATNLIDWGKRASQPVLVAWTSRWIAARRRWLAPCFSQDRQPTVLREHTLVGYCYEVQPDSPGVAFICNLSRTSGQLTLPGQGWTVILGHEHIHVDGGVVEMRGKCAGLLVHPV